MRAQQNTGLKAFLKAREFLLVHPEDYDAAYRNFSWPELDKFNWALDYFDALAGDNNRQALWIVDEHGPEVKLVVVEISRRSSQTAHFTPGHGICRTARIIVQHP